MDGCGRHKSCRHYRTSRFPFMNAILIQLEKPVGGTEPENENWRKAITEFSASHPIRKCPAKSLGCLLSLDGDASPDLATAITVAVKYKIAYKITFFEKRQSGTMIRRNNMLHNLPDPSLRLPSRATSSLPHHNLMPHNPESIRQATRIDTGPATHN